MPVPARPPVEAYVMLGNLPDRAMPANDGVPRSRQVPLRFVRKLLTAWAAMGFRRPAIDFVTRSLDF